MNYFFVPIVKGVETHVTLSTFPPIGSINQYKKGFYIYVASVRNKTWHIQNMGQIGTVDSIGFEFNEKLIKSFETTPLVMFLYPNLLPETLDKLIVSSIMNTGVAWRANLRFCSQTSRVSFQAEYPDSMLSIPKGSLTSFSPMVQISGNVHTKLILVNVRDVPLQDQRSLVFLKLKSKEVLKRTVVSTNNCNIIDIDEVHSPDDPIGVFSPDMAGIPLYFTHNDDFSMMSLEHTHPPHSSIFFGKDRQEIVSGMKRYWLKRISDVANPNL